MRIYGRWLNHFSRVFTNVIFFNAVGLAFQVQALSRNDFSSQDVKLPFFICRLCHYIESASQRSILLFLLRWKKVGQNEKSRLVEICKLESQLQLLNRNLLV